MSRFNAYPDGFNLLPGDRVLVERQGRTLSVSGAGVVGSATPSEQFEQYKAFTDGRVTALTNQVNQLINLVEAATGQPIVSLNALYLSTTAFTAGTLFNAAIYGATAGSTITATASDGTTLNVANGLLSGTFLNAGPKTITLTETLDGAFNSPNPSQVIAAVADSATPTPTPSPTLNALTVSNPTATVGTPYSGTISGLTSGSSVALTGPGAAGLSIGGAVISGTPTTAGAINLVETLAGATNSPNPSAGVVTVAAAGVPTIAFANPTATVQEGDTGTKAVSNVINVTRNGVTGSLTINLTYGGTATSGTDYVAGPVSATIADGANSASFDLTINGDTAVESNETIIINAVLAAYTSSTASKTITITDDDAVAIPNYATIAAGGDSYTVGLNASPNTTGWMYQVASALGATLTNSAVSGTVLQNSADSGGSSRASNLRDSYASFLLGSNKKAAAFLAIGYNDGRYTGAPSTFNVANYQNDYREVLNGLLIGGYSRNDIYVVSPFYPTDTGLNTGSTGFTGQTRSGFAAFVAAAAAVAKEFGVRYVDVYTPLGVDPAYIADVDGSDHIHPAAYGHAAIKNTVLNSMTAPNTLAAPASVTATTSGSGVTVTAAAVTGAASYEYSLVANPVDYASNTTGSFSSVPNGSYYPRARPVFGDGTKGPWTFAASAITVAAVTLNTLTLSGTLKNGTASSGTINGATSGSSIVSNVTGLTVDSTARTYSFDGTAAAATIANGLVETLAGATGSPKSSPITVAAASSTMFVNASFTGTDGTAITSYTPEAGGGFVAAPVPGNVTNTASVLQTGRLASVLTNSGTQVAVHRATAAASSADHYVEAVVDFLSAIAGQGTGIGARMDPTTENYYWARYNATAGGWQLYKTVSGTTTQLGTTFTDAFASGSRTARLTVSGSTISLSVDGTVVVTVTDAAIPTGSYVGTRLTNTSTAATTATTGRQITSLTAATL
jgi:lysophospholipase L1-like esterase